MPAAKPLKWRIAAVMAYFMCWHLRDGPKGEPFWAAFNKKFRELEPEHDMAPGAARKFASLWVKRFKATGGLQERTRRKPNMPASVVRAIGEALMEGREVEYIKWKKTGTGRWRHFIIERLPRWAWYSSFHQFVSLNPWVKLKMAHYKITSEKTLLRLMRRELPKLHRGMVRPRAPLTEEHKRSRSAFAHRLLKKAGHPCRLPGSNWLMRELDVLLHYLLRVCWIDEKKLYIMPRPHAVWARAGADLTDPDPRVPMGQKALKGVKVVYYAVVNAILGPIYFEYVTGTADHERDLHYKKYKVSPPACPSQPIRAGVGDQLLVGQRCCYSDGPLVPVRPVQPDKALPHPLACCIHLPVPLVLHSCGRAVVAAFEVLLPIHLNSHIPMYQINVKALAQAWH
jgi:hypothetical protein